MRILKVTSILLVSLISLSLLNFALKYYTYFVIIVSSSKNSTNEIDAIVQETGEVPHPHELFVPLLTFIPTKSPVFSRPWVLLTSGLIEENFIDLTFSFMLMFYIGKYLETMWSPKEFNKYIIANIVGSNIILYLFYCLKSLFASDQVPPLVVSSMAGNMALLVAIKQRIPNHYFLFFKGSLRIKVNYLPFILLMVCGVLQILDEDFKISFLLGSLGFVISWTYLRFIKVGSNERQSYILPFALSRKKSDKGKFNPGKLSQKEKSSISSFHIENSGITGDRSEQFALHTFFPHPLSIIVKLLSNVVFECLAHYKFIDKRNFIEEEDNDDQLMLEDIEKLQSKLFGLSSLKGAGNVSTIPKASSKIKLFLSWLKSPTKAHSNIKTIMDKKRKLALKELD